ncbi:hypothetical protein A3C96_02875 [Candidatus Uhrbacteria bacterium RIFCSPHIGHO2_02_FULL_60_10]|uniref:Peptidase M10 metallopeptidase domain-containing protein n=1 Tax=Candidatus Uhrbacteria bacterium RIFCSPHIGHO2_02_FULL_60_10 TaxID=1802392 RepID=A0A1F7U7I9_9BACT|nr:MAG: hypothetical protein A3C96_02875 [Candidatus Uhrbacteria bacterium RIFCSPHIGHO2_02_FULL_60_10]
MPRISLFCGALCLALLNACATPTRIKTVDRPVYSLTMWLEKHPLLNAESALRGCQQWQPKGVICRLTTKRSEANVFVLAVEKPCRPEEDGKRVLARAYAESKLIAVYADCFLNGAGAYDHDIFQIVMTHEIGHQVGIWEHVAEKCTEQTPRHPNGRSVCGEAAMNPTVDERVNYITEIDGLAFDLRRRDYTALTPLQRMSGESQPRVTPDGAEPDCIFRTK